MARPRIENRVKPHKALYRCQLNIRKNIFGSSQLAMELSNHTGDEISKHAVRDWESKGWPPERWNQLLDFLGMTEEQAREQMFLKEGNE